MEFGLEARIVYRPDVIRQSTLNAMRVPLELTVAVIDGHDEGMPQVDSTPVPGLGFKGFQ